MTSLLRVVGDAGEHVQKHPLDWEALTGPAQRSCPLVPE